MCKVLGSIPELQKKKCSEIHVFQIQPEYHQIPGRGLRVRNDTRIQSRDKKLENNHTRLLANTQLGKILVSFFHV
jgi:hypothetical protein